MGMLLRKSHISIKDAEPYTFSLEVRIYISLTLLSIDKDLQRVRLFEEFRMLRCTRIAPPCENKTGSTNKANDDSSTAVRFESASRVRYIEMANNRLQRKENRSDFLRITKLCSSTLLL